ncbi:EpsG family protein [Gracilibacillus caseinilyticus]|uniref:EpsG family protein n=1 Tax=Gracilibacillus caseinilyticus TaxID=2932256 RepID=A0ABY4F266_9BACI|nr:EpsG family protein [Gracilibacillus caseinilyticus]UOQ50326.1 EpsG family protein [Gracilibacillus caseinilyticus]
MFHIDLKSLVIYSSVFIVSILFIKEYQKKCSYYDSSVEIKSNDIVKRYTCLFFVSLIPTLIAGLRYGVGTDYFNYWDMFYWYNDLSLKELLINENERFFKLVIIISDFLFQNPIWMFVLSHFITMMFLLAAVTTYKNKFSYSFSLFIFFMSFWSFSLNITRQFIAVTIVLFAIKYILRRSFVKYVIFILIATQFHMSAIICIIFYFLNFKKSTLIQYLYYLMIIFTPIVLPFLIILISKIPLFQEYTTTYELGNPFQIDFIYSAKTFFWFLILVGPIIFYKNGVVNQKYNVLFNILILELPLVYMGNFNLFANRLALFPQIIQIIIIPLVISSIKNPKEKRLVFVYYCILYLFIYLQRFVFSNQGDIFPYISIF